MTDPEVLKFLRKQAKKGGEAIKAKRGPGYFKMLGKRSANKRWGKRGDK